MAPTTEDSDRRFMALALALARRGLGRVWPNPAVGCVLVKDGAVLARGWTGTGGRPHAETRALARAGARARGATCYVSLEPCAHHGETPPCADALVAAGIARAVIAAADPDPRVDGAGSARLEAAGIEVATGVREDEALEVNAGFFLRVREGRPLVTLKLASTLDGRIATRTGESRWITGETARRFAHMLRARNDAVLVGAGTVAADDPELTCRLPGLAAASPVRCVVDGRIGIPLTARLVATAGKVPTWLFALPDAPADRRRALADAGVEVIEVEAGPDGNPDVLRVLAAMAGRGITRLLCEGGSRLSASLLRARAVDRLAWFRAARVIGGDGRPATEAFGIEALADAPGFTRVAVQAAGEDLMETYARA